MTDIETWVLRAAALTGAILTLGAVLLWLVWPRVKTALRIMITEATRENTETIRHELAGDRPDTVAGHAKTAARESAQTREQLGNLAVGLRELDEWRQSTDRRLGLLEEALIALLSDELRARIYGKTKTTKATED